jgi:hypothetical protein
VSAGNNLYGKTDMEQKTLRINWCDAQSLGQKYKTYDLEQPSQDWANILEILSDLRKSEDIFFEVGRTARDPATEPWSDFNHDLVLHYFDIDVGYGSH